MGIIATVYAHPKHNCSLNGISSRFTEVTVVNVEGPFDPTPERPAVLMERHTSNAIRLVPCSDQGVKDPGIWWMFGGSYVATSDGRFSGKAKELLGHEFYGAVALHDRNEGQ